MKSFFQHGLILLIILVSSAAQAKIFRNAYIAFEMPENWKCSLEATEWVCRSEFEKQSREAVIILTAKEVGPTDTLAHYESHLNAIKTVTSRAGQPSQSKVFYKSKAVQINEQKWIDGMHLGSEIPNYYTRYMATIKDRIAILVTFSAHRLHYTEYSKDFFRAVMSLRVIASKGLLDRPDTGPLKPGSETLGAPIGSTLPAEMGEVAYPTEKKGGSTTKALLFGLALILAAIGGYLYWKSRKKT